MYAPLSGTVAAVNEELGDEPGKVNDETPAWMVRLKASDASELDALMDEAAYEEYLKNLDN